MAARVVRKQASSGNTQWVFMMLEPLAELILGFVDAGDLKEGVEANSKL